MPRSSLPGYTVPLFPCRVLTMVRILAVPSKPQVNQNGTGALNVDMPLTQELLQIHEEWFHKLLLRGTVPQASGLSSRCLPLRTSSWYARWSHHDTGDSIHFRRGSRRLVFGAGRDPLPCSKCETTSVSVLANYLSPCSVFVAEPRHLAFGAKEGPSLAPKARWLGCLFFGYTPQLPQTFCRCPLLPRRRPLISIISMWRFLAIPPPATFSSDTPSPHVSPLHSSLDSCCIVLLSFLMSRHIGTSLSHSKCVTPSVISYRHCT
jgi:hypothetical protein